MVANSLAVGDAWRLGCPKSPDWDSDVESWTVSEGTSSEQCEHNVEGFEMLCQKRMKSGSCLAAAQAACGHSMRRKEAAL